MKISSATRRIMRDGCFPDNKRTSSAPKKSTIKADTHKDDLKATENKPIGSQENQHRTERIRLCGVFLCANVLKGNDMTLIWQKAT